MLSHPLSLPLLSQSSWELLLDSCFQQCRSQANGVPDLHGDGQFVRRSILEVLGGSTAWNELSVTDDLDMTFRIALMGYRVEYLRNWFAVLEEPVYSM